MAKFTCLGVVALCSNPQIAANFTATNEDLSYSKSLIIQNPFYRTLNKYNHGSDSNLTMNIGPIEQKVLGNQFQIPAPAPVACRRITLNFLMNFTPGELGLNYRVNAVLFANDRQADDHDNSNAVSAFPLFSDSGLEEISSLTSSGPFPSLFPRNYDTVMVTSTSIPYQISKYVLESKLDEDPGFRRTQRFPPRFTPYNDELLARVAISHVAEAEVKSIAQAL